MVPDARPSSSPYGESQVGRRELKGALGGGQLPTADGDALGGQPVLGRALAAQHRERSGLPFATVSATAALLEAQRLLAEDLGPQDG